MVHALGVARHFRADDARRVGLLLGAVHAADATRREQLNIERAARRAIVRAGRAEASDLDGSVHVSVRDYAKRRPLAPITAGKGRPVSRQYCCRKTTARFRSW